MSRSVGQDARTPAIVLGGSGYVAGELLRILSAHPFLEAAAVVSESKPGSAVTATFPHLAGSLDGLAFCALDELAAQFDGWAAAGRARAALFSAAPHGASAALVDRVLREAEERGVEVHAVDLSADFRFADAAQHRQIYGHDHGAPERLREFSSAVPEHVQGVPTRHVGHPGCFTTAVSLATVPLVALGLVAPVDGPARLTAVAITGSTGSGRTPSAKTHHPERRSNLQAYGAFSHRHRPEMEALVAARAGRPATIEFLPHSGPFARGIHATVTARLSDTARDLTAGDIAERLRDFYAGSPFVSVSVEPPALQSVVGTNRAALGVAVSDGTVAVFSVLDNLVKGAAGGGVQWMNRLFGWPEDAGLRLPGLGWL
jgi:N-acetyl-gamma-glutamyl-phosphate reductase common form